MMHQETLVKITHSESYQDALIGKFFPDKAKVSKLLETNKYWKNNGKEAGVYSQLSRTRDYRNRWVKFQVATMQGV